MMVEGCEILLVEDNSADAELTIHALRRHKLAHRIEVARDGAQALDYIFCRGAYSGRSFDRPPGIILLDLKLPKVNGHEVLCAVKGDPRTRPIPVVVLTSSKDERDLIQSYRLGVNSYIQKHVDFAQFQETIRHFGLYWLVINQPPPNAAFANPPEERKE